jgi:hypothetical protein
MLYLPVFTFDYWGIALGVYGLITVILAVLLVGFTLFSIINKAKRYIEEVGGKKIKKHRAPPRLIGLHLARVGQAYVLYDSLFLRNFLPFILATSRSVTLYHYTISEGNIVYGRRFLGPNAAQFSISLLNKRIRDDNIVVYCFSPERYTVNITSNVCYTTYIFTRVV